MEKVYKIYREYTIGDEKRRFYIKNRGKTEIFVSIGGARAAITMEVNSRNHYQQNVSRSEYHIEEYSCNLVGEVSNA